MLWCGLLRRARCDARAETRRAFTLGDAEIGKDPVTILHRLVRFFTLSLTGSTAVLACGASDEGDGSIAMGPVDMDPVGTIPVMPGAPTDMHVVPSDTSTSAPGTTAPAQGTPQATGGTPVVQSPTPGVSGVVSPEPEPGIAPGTGLGSGQMGGSGQSADRWKKADVTRNGLNYFLMANGWGPGFVSQTISWNGTSFTVDSMEGTQGDNWEPASYPTVFCGVYSDSQSQACGLPASIDSLNSLRTGWKWEPNGNTGEYNAAYDIWLGNGTERRSFSGFLMVWLREPPGQQPAGSRTEIGVSVANVPGTWHIWTGTVNGAPIVNWVRAEGDDSLELEFDVLDFIRDAQQRGIEVPGTHILSVAVGFEIWNGPVTNLESVDFYVDPK